MILSSLWLEDKYANLASPRLSRFAKRGPNTYNFRCPYCGDSSKNKFKSRGYIYQKKGRMFYRCHNCGIGKTFVGFLMDVDPGLYKEFRLETLREAGKRPERKRDEIEPPQMEGPTNVLAGLTKVGNFPEDHPVRKYLNGRLITDDIVENLYYSNRFMEWVNTVLPNKFTDSQLKRDEPRLVIPFMDEDGNVFAVTGRSFKKSSIKYLTIKFDESKDKIFGMDKVDPTKRVYVVEGPIDSFFLDNSIAFAGSSGSIPKFDDFVVVLDNEPRNKEIVRLMEKFIEAGYNVCIWPDGTDEKDINEMIGAGKTQDEIKATIDENTFSGLMATARMNQYKKV